MRPAAWSAWRQNHRATLNRWLLLWPAQLRSAGSDRKPRIDARRATAGAPCSRPSVLGRPFLIACRSSFFLKFLSRKAGEESISSPSSLGGDMDPSPPCAGFGISEESLAQLLQTRFYVLAQMHPQNTPLAIRQDLEVASCLRRLDHSERVLLTWHRQIHCVIAGDLQEDPGVGSAFVSLSG